MTEQQQAYEALRQRRNELIPEALKLRFGCEVRRFHNTDPEYFCGFEGGIPKIVRVGQHYDFYRDGKFTVLGTPVTLQELLLMLKDKKIQLQSNGVLQEVSGDTYETEVATILCNYDLMKSVSGQGVRTLQAVLALLDNTK